MGTARRLRSRCGSARMFRHAHAAACMLILGQGAQKMRMTSTTSGQLKAVISKAGRTKWRDVAAGAPPCNCVSIGSFAAPRTCMYNMRYVYTLPVGLHLQWTAHSVQLTSQSGINIKDVHVYVDVAAFHLVLWVSKQQWSGATAMFSCAHQQLAAGNGAQLQKLKSNTLPSPPISLSPSRREDVIVTAPQCV